MKASFSASIWTLVLALCSTSLAVPTPDAEVAARSPVKFVDVSDAIAKRSTDVTLERRGGAHEAHIYSNFNCVNGFSFFANFGCGGTCYTNLNGNSIYLQQATTGNPKPTANLYNSNDCSGNSQHAGIFSGQLSGCTNSNSGTWQSAFLYYNC